MREGSKRKKHRKGRRNVNGGTSFLEYIVPTGLLAATELMKRRSKKHVRSRSYLVHNNNKKSRRRRY
jgi:hypothetical protein